MANLKEIRTRITSVKSTRQITSAMKMVSAAKLRRAQDAIQKIRPYSEKLNEILSNLSSSVNIEDIPFAEERDLKKVLIVVVTSNKGLCGGFNSSVIKNAIHHAQTNYPDLMEKQKVEFLAIGKKGYETLKYKNYFIIGDENQLFDDLTFNNVNPVANRLMQQFLKKDYDRIDIVYNQFKNAATQILTIEQFLPIKELSEGDEHSSFTQDYIFEPSKEYILKNIIPNSLKIQFYKALLDSNAAEHGARMTSMHQATDNATALIGDLTLLYNKARQSSITTEILEIVAGAEALKSK